MSEVQEEEHEQELLLHDEEHDEEHDEDDELLQDDELHDDELEELLDTIASSKFIVIAVSKFFH
jgi:hypothetical protein